MKQLTAIITVLAFALISCEDLTDLNDNPKKPQEVSHETLFSNAQLSVTDIMTSSNVNLNIFRLIVQYWTQTTYIDETRYDLAGRSINDNFWHDIYRDVLVDLQESQRLLMEGGAADVEVQNELAMIEIMQVYAWSILVSTYGDIPYEEALDIDNIRPDYTPQSEVFDDLLVRLTSAIDQLDPSAGGFGDADLLYGGNIGAWIKFGNSLKLRIGMTLADVTPARASTIVQEVQSSVFTSSGDNAVFQYSTIPPNTNPIWVDLIQSKRQDFIAATTIVGVMDSLNDPRMNPYFTYDGEGGFSGGVVGSRNNFSDFSKPDSTITSKDFEAIFLSYSEVEFLLAEAAARGFISDDPAMHYNEAITASIMYWGGTQAEADAYLAQPEVAYATAGTNGFREKIGIQQWISLYNRGWEAWTSWRRLDYPQLEPAVRAISGIPVRFSYPVTEQNLNQQNYEKAASRLPGEGDVVETPLFWDEAE